MPTAPVSHTRLVFESAGVLALVAGIFGFEWMHLRPEDGLTYLLLLLVPGTATVVYCGVGAVVPNLFAARRIGWPLAVTLPVVYGAILQLCAALWKRSPNPIVKQELFNHAASFWQRFQPALGLLACQLAVFVAWSAVAGRSRPSE